VIAIPLPLYIKKEKFRADKKSNPLQDPNHFKTLTNAR